MGGQFGKIVRRFWAGHLSINESLGFVQLPLFNKPGSSGSDSSSELANNGTASSQELLNDRFQKKNNY